MNMITNFDTQAPTVLDDADLEAVSGGDARDAAVRVALGYIYRDALADFVVGDMFWTKQHSCL
jgi:hypothetical protein